jgi:hypothetical protein
MAQLWLEKNKTVIKSQRFIECAHTFNGVTVINVVDPSPSSLLAAGNPV